MKDEKQQFNVYLSPSLVAQAKHRAIDEQRSLSDFTSEALRNYMEKTTPALTLQPIIHVDDLAASVAFYETLGAQLIVGSRDGDWAQLSIGGSEIGLLAHPANPEQNEGAVEICFEYRDALQELEQRLIAADVVIRRGAADEAFGEQLQIEAPGGMLIKINKIDPSTFS